MKIVRRIVKRIWVHLGSFVIAVFLILAFKCPDFGVNPKLPLKYNFKILVIRTQIEKRLFYPVASVYLPLQTIFSK